MKDKIDLLINVLFDNSAREDERDDAAMDLGRFEDDKALNALLGIASNIQENETVVDSCGESIGRILSKKEIFNKDVFNKLSPIARASAFSFLKEERPEWLKYL